MMEADPEDSVNMVGLPAPINIRQQQDNRGAGRMYHGRRLSLPIFMARAPAQRHDTLRDAMRKRNNVEWHHKDYTKLPADFLQPLTKPVTAAMTGPKEGIRDVEMKYSKPNLLSHPRYNGRVRCFNEWTRPEMRAFGIGTSLYEKNPNLDPDYTTGDPVADVFAIVARENSCILSLADGVNWGDKSRLAARCGVAGSIQYLNHYLCSATTTHDVMELLCRSFELAQDCIVESGATMTTLCTAVICPIRGSDKWAVCVINVGDSLAFVYSKETATHSGRTREITVGSHCSETERDMRCPGGSLGPVDGYNPDLTNLTFSYTQVSAGDIVFLTSDGVSDNFDPVVSQCNHCQGQLRHSVSMDSLSGTGTMNNIQTPRSDMDTNAYGEWDVPTMRHHKTLCDMQEAIELEIPDDLSAQTLCANLINHVAKCTQEKRNSLEKKLKEGQTRGPAHKINENEIRKIMKELPGKLDHAAVVAFEVGHFPLEHLRVVSDGPNRHRNIIGNLRGMLQGLTGGPSQDDGRNQLVNLLSPPS